MGAADPKAVGWRPAPRYGEGAVHAATVADRRLSSRGPGCVRWRQADHLGGRVTNRADESHGEHEPIHFSLEPALAVRREIDVKKATAIGPEDAQQSAIHVRHEILDMEMNLHRLPWAGLDQKCEIECVRKIAVPNQNCCPKPRVVPPPGPGSLARLNSARSIIPR